MNKARTVLAFTIGPVLVVGLASGCGSASEGPPPASSSSSASAAGQSGPTLDQAADVIAATYQALVNLDATSRDSHVAPVARTELSTTAMEKIKATKVVVSGVAEKAGPAVKPGQARYAATLTFTGEGDGTQVERRWFILQHADSGPVIAASGLVALVQAMPPYEEPATESDVVDAPEVAALTEPEPVATFEPPVAPTSDACATADLDRNLAQIEVDYIQTEIDYKEEEIATKAAERYYSDDSRQDVFDGIAQRMALTALEEELSVLVDNQSANQAIIDALNQSCP
ncbi:MAG TPA: hypothetical protein PLF68_12545 [Nitrospira sp.]|nr:hypothetical protein [Nitrospira sp.]